MSNVEEILARSDALDAAIDAGDYDRAVIGLVKSRKKERQRSRRMFLLLLVDVALTLGLAGAYYFASNRALLAQHVAAREARNRSAAVCAGENEIISSKIRPVIDFVTTPHAYPPHALPSQIAATNTLNEQYAMFRATIEGKILTPINCPKLTGG